MCQRNILRKCCSCCSVSTSCLTLCHPMVCSTTNFSVLHYLPEFAQTHTHWFSDAIELYDTLPPPSPFAFNLSQHHGLFQGEGCSHQVAKGLEFQLSHPSLQWIFRVNFFLDWLVWFPCSPRDSQKSSPVPQLKALSHLILVRILRICGTWATTQPTHPAQHNGSSVSGGCTQEDGGLSPPSCLRYLPGMGRPSGLCCWSWIPSNGG